MHEIEPQGTDAFGQGAQQFLTGMLMQGTQKGRSMRIRNSIFSIT
jgi:hypothetical protein